VAVAADVLKRKMGYEQDYYIDNQVISPVADNTVVSGTHKGESK
jgi:hypothetical protein